MSQRPPSSPSTAPDAAALLSGRLVVVALACCCGLSFVAYGSSLFGDFVFDDLPALQQSDCHRGLHRIWEMFNIGSGSICSHRPIRSLSYAVDHALWGLDPFGYHLSNVVLHAVVGLLLGLVVLRLGGRRRLAALVAALFLVHPIGTEAVAYISGRRDILAALFSLAATLCFFDPRARRGMLRTTGALLCFALALLCHESAAALPAALLLLELALRVRSTPATGLRQALRELLSSRRIMLTTAAMLLLAALYGAWKVFGANPSQRHSLWGPDLGAHVGTMLRVHAHYLKQLVYPANLIADYSQDAFPVSRSLVELPALVSTALVLGIMGLALRLWRSAPLGAATTLSYFALLLPVSQIVIHHELLAEHRLYLAATCFCALLAWVLDRFVAWRGRLGWAVVATVLLSYAALTNSRNLDWRSEETLWARTVEQVPRCARALGNLGTQLLERGEVKRAHDLLERAVSIRPELCAARVNLGEALLRLGEQPIRAMRLIEEASCLPPWRHHYRRARGYAITGRWRAAAAAYRQAIASGPPHAQSHHGLARALHALRDPRAIAEYRKALQLRPGSPQLLLDLGRALAETCQQAEARQVLGRLGSQQAGAAQQILRSMERACPGMTPKQEPTGKPRRSKEVRAAPASRAAVARSRRAPRDRLPPAGHRCPPTVLTRFSSARHLKFRNVYRPTAPRRTKPAVVVWPPPVETVQRFATAVGALKGANRDLDRFVEQHRLKPNQPREVKRSGRLLSLFGRKPASRPLTEDKIWMIVSYPDLRALKRYANVLMPKLSGEEESRLDALLSARDTALKEQHEAVESMRYFLAPLKHGSERQSSVPLPVLRNLDRAEAACDREEARFNGLEKLVTRWTRMSLLTDRPSEPVRDNHLTLLKLAGFQPPPQMTYSDVEALLRDVKKSRQAAVATFQSALDDADSYLSRTDALQRADRAFTETMGAVGTETTTYRMLENMRDRLVRRHLAADKWSTP